jgi:predicted ATPase/class 3 adenylate cyclase
MQNQPTGVVSFLMSDVVDSTRMWESDRAGMAASLEAHDGIFRQETAAHGGHVFSTAGDAFAVAFATPADCVLAAIAIQARLADTDWPGPPIRVRMGIHTGTTDERDGDYFGPTLNRTARIMAAGHGGHILVSAVTADLLSSRIGPDFELLDRGSHRLKGLHEQIQIFEVAHGHAPEGSFALRTEDVPGSNLPDPLSSFVGRTRELQEVTSRLSETRLVTLTGAGGTGKTRLAVESARAKADAFGDGAWLVELARISDPSLVMTAIGEVFGLRPGDGVPIEEVVGRHLRSRRLLIVLDNCEHVLSGAADAVRRLLADLADLTVLATSRETLGIDGEFVIRVPALAVPDGSGGGVSDSVRLFLDRAEAAGVPIEDEDLPHVERICRQVDGMPLAVELAAARLRTMSAGELADRLGHSFQVLTGPRKSTTTRHRTLETTIDWSYELLDGDEQALFRHLSVFAGGFDMAAADAVATETSSEVIDLVDSLVDKSLVNSRRTDHGLRFAMLEPVRQYAQLKLEELGELETAREAHARYFVGFVAEASPHTRSADQMRWFQRIDADYDNIRLAFANLLASEQMDAYLRMAFDLFMYWVHTSLHQEAIAACVTGVQAADESVDPMLIARVWFIAACMGAEITSVAAIDHARQGLETAKRTGDRNAIGRLELALGAAIRHSTTDPEYLEHLIAARSLLDEHAEPSWWEPEWDRGFLNLLLTGYLPSEDERVGEHLEVATSSFERVGDQAMLGATLFEGIGAWSSDQDRMIGSLRRALEIFEDVRAGYFQAHARMYYGVLMYQRQEVDEAAVFLSDGSEQLEDLGDLNCWATAVRWLAECEAEMGMIDDARRHLTGVLDILAGLPLQEVAVPRTLDSVIVTLAAAGRYEPAALLLGFAEMLPFPPTVFPRDQRLAALADRVTIELGEEKANRLRAEGAVLDQDAAIRRASAEIDW